MANNISMENHRFATSSDILAHARQSKSIQQHQKNITELISDIDYAGDHARMITDYEDLVEYLRNEFLMEDFKTPDAKVKITDSNDGIYCKANGKTTQSRDAFEKSWIEKGFDYFSYTLGQIDRSEQSKMFKEAGLKIN